MAPPSTATSHPLRFALALPAPSRSPSPPTDERTETLDPEALEAAYQLVAEIGAAFVRGSTTTTTTTTTTTSTTPLLSATPLTLLPGRLAHGLEHIDIRLRRARVEITCPIVREAVGRLCQIIVNDGGEFGDEERAEAGAVLERVGGREVVCCDGEEEGEVEVEERWAVDCERRNGRIHDRLHNTETTRLIPWRYPLNTSPTSPTSPSLVFDVLLGRVRRLEMGDSLRFADAERLGVRGGEMSVSRERGVWEAWGV